MLEVHKQDNAQQRQPTPNKRDFAILARQVQQRQRRTTQRPTPQ